MIGVVYHLRDSDNFRYELDHVRFSASALGADTLILIDETTFHAARYYQDTSIRIVVFDTLVAAEAAYPNPVWYYLEPNKNLDGLPSCSLHELSHATDAVYVVGPDFSSIQSDGREDKHWVYIPIEPDRELYAKTVIALVLYDRRGKTCQLP